MREAIRCASRAGKNTIYVYFGNNRQVSITLSGNVHEGDLHTILNTLNGASEPTAEGTATQEVA